MFCLFSIEEWISKGFKLKRAGGPFVHSILFSFILITFVFNQLFYFYSSFLGGVLVSTFTRSKTFNSSCPRKNGKRKAGIYIIYFISLLIMSLLEVSFALSVKRGSGRVLVHVCICVHAQSMHLIDCID